MFQYKYYKSIMIYTNHVFRISWLGRKHCYTKSFYCNVKQQEPTNVIVGAWLISYELGRIEWALWTVLHSIATQLSSSVMGILSRRLDWSPWVILLLRFLTRFTHPFKSKLFLSRVIACLIKNIEKNYFYLFEYCRRF